MKEFTWGLPLQCIYLRCCGDGRQAALIVETFLEAIAAQGGDMMSTEIVLLVKDVIVR